MAIKKDPVELFTPDIELEDIDCEEFLSNTQLMNGPLDCSVSSRVEDRVNIFSIVNSKERMMTSMNVRVQLQL